jgi:(p)ppGpp synthase/HD superfamily hydrolase
LTVGVILAKVGADDDVVAAGILHDTIEDSIEEKKVTAEMIADRFGEKVSRLVLSVTEKEKTFSWDERKKDALEKIATFSHDSLLVKSADIISNVSELLDDHARYGDEVFDRFKATKEKTIDHQLKSIKAIVSRWPENPLAEDLEKLSFELALK